MCWSTFIAVYIGSSEYFYRLVLQQNWFKKKKPMAEKILLSVVMCICICTLICEVCVLAPQRYFDFVFYWFYRFEFCIQVGHGFFFNIRQKKIWSRIVREWSLLHAFLNTQLFVSMKFVLASTALKSNYVINGILNQKLFFQILRWWKTLQRSLLIFHTLIIMKCWWLGMWTLVFVFLQLAWGEQEHWSPAT